MQNVAAEAIEELSEEERRKISPIDTILLAMRAALKAGNLPEAAQFAAMASPYCHPRLASSDVRLESDNAHRVVSDKPMTIDEWQAEFAAQHANDATMGEPPENEREAGD